MRSLTSDNEGAGPALTRGRARVTKRDTWRDMSRGRGWERGFESKYCDKERVWSDIC